MKANETKALLEEWGISSHSRPRVSNDNPYSESFFRSLKYTGRYPRKGFESIEVAQQWLEGYLSRYNEQSYHSGVNWVTPKSRFDGTDEAVLKARKQVLERARERHPDHWIRSRVWDCTPPPRKLAALGQARRAQDLIAKGPCAYAEPSLFTFTVIGIPPCTVGATIKLSHIAPPLFMF